jgi:DNA-binding response OmpR family regulator
MPIRVLVVDDSPTIRKVVGAVLQRHGFDAISAGDGQAALDELLKSTRPPEVGEPPPVRIDVVLVDFVMPRMNGFQLCRAIRQNEALRSTPVVLMSAKSDRIRDHFVQQTGAIDAISKPFDARALVAVIENAIRRTEQWRARGDTDFAEVLEEIEVVEPVSATELTSAAHAALSGDLAIIPVGAALQLLQIENQSGVLSVSDGKVEVAITMRQGLIDLVIARGAGNEFRLGRYFVEHGLLSTDDIEAVLRDQPRRDSQQGHKLLGDMLVDSGRITPDQLREALARQSSELVYDVLRWPRGRFDFRREPSFGPPVAESTRLALPVASVVMEGFRRVDEWRVVEAGLGNFDSVLLADIAAVQAVGTERLAKSEQRLLEMVDGERTIREIIEHSHMSSFDACKILFQLLEARLVRRRNS